MEKRTTIDKIEIHFGVVQVRFAKQILDDNGTVLSSQWHRTTIEPGGDVDAQINAVNTNLVAMGFAPVLEGIGWLQQIVAAVQKV